MKIYIVLIVLMIVIVLWHSPGPGPDPGPYRVSSPRIYNLSLQNGGVNR